MTLDRAGRARSIVAAVVVLGVAVGVGIVVRRSPVAPREPGGAAAPSAQSAFSGRPTLATPTPNPAYAALQRITLADAYARFQKGDALFVDVRHNLLFQGQHIPGAISIPYAEAADRVGELPRDRDIIVYCACSSAQESARAALAWAEHGMTNVFVLWDGLNPWRAAGYPLEPPPKTRLAPSPAAP